MAAEIRPYRFRLPEGLSHFDSSFGEKLQKLRRATGETQQEVADAIGITRTALARLENGKTWPRPDTFDALQGHFEIDGGKLAVRLPEGEKGLRPVRPYSGTRRGATIHRMGADLRESRKEKGYKLRQVAAWSGVSAAQLSRIERGECWNSPLIGTVDDDKFLHKDDRPLTFTNQVLLEIYLGTFVPPADK